MRPLRVLIADDEPDALTTLGMLLGSEGADVRLATGGMQVPQAVAQFAPDAVILDLALPDHSGLDVARELQDCYGRRCPMLICVTGRTSESDRQKAAQCGFRHFVAKPYDPREFLKLVLSLPRRPDPGAGQLRLMTPEATRAPTSRSS